MKPLHLLILFALLFVGCPKKTEYQLAGIEKISGLDGRSYLNYKFKYQDGRLSEIHKKQKHFNGTDTIEINYVFVYDKNNIVELKSFRNEIEYQTYYSYDAKNRLIKRVSLENKLQMNDSGTNYEYDDYDRITIERSFRKDNDGKTYQEIFKYFYSDSTAFVPITMTLNNEDTYEYSFDGKVGLTRLLNVSRIILEPIIYLNGIPNEENMIDYHGSRHTNNFTYSPEGYPLTNIAKSPDSLSSDMYIKYMYE